MLLYQHWDDKRQVALYIAFSLCSILILPLIAIGILSDFPILVYLGIAAAPVGLVIAVFMVVDDWRWVLRRVPQELNHEPLFEEVYGRPLQRITIYDDLIVIRTSDSTVIRVADIEDVIVPGFPARRALDLKLRSGQLVPLYMRSRKPALAILHERLGLPCN